MCKFVNRQMQMKGEAKYLELAIEAVFNSTFNLLLS